MKAIIPSFRFLTTCFLLLTAAVPGITFAQWTIPSIGGILPNSATSLGGDCFEFTNNTSQRGVVWNNTQMDLTQPFDITLNVWHDVHGADGVALVLQTTGLTANGAGGNANGYANSVPASSYPGISPSVAIELDLFFNNVAGVNDIAADHVAIHVNGDLATPAMGPTPAYPNSANVPDNTCIPLRVVWTPAPTSSMVVFWDNQLRMVWNQDIVNTVFGGNNNVFWGITGSCGSVQMTQRVCVGADFAEAGPDQTICLGETAQLNASGGGTYLWGLGFPFISDPTIANPVFSSTFPQVVDLPLAVTDVLGCVDRDTVQITVLDAPTVVAGGISDICPGDSATITANVSGGAAPYTYAWSNGDLSGQISVSPANTTLFSVTVTDDNGCTAVDDTTLTVNPLETIDILNSDTALCLGAGLSNINVINSNGIDTYSWTPTTGVTNPGSPTTSLVPQQTTTYILQGTNSTTGCSARDSLHIDVFDLQVADFPDSTVCLGDTVRILVQPTGGSGDYSIQWIQTGTDTLSSDTVLEPFIVAVGGGTYFANITDNISGCTQTLMTTITVRNLTVFATPNAILINPGQRVQLEAFGAMEYTWEPDTMLSCANCPSPVSMPTSAITYTVTGTDTTGCIGVATVTIVTDSLFIPNVFSPNGDGINDELLLNYHGEALYQVAVYDRWGKEIFQTRDKLVMWNGLTQNGTAAPEGVYFLAVKIIGDDAIPAKDKQRVFHVTLMR